MTARVVPKGFVRDASVDRHRRRLGEQAARSVRAVEQDVIAAADHDDCAGDLAAGDGLVCGVVDSGKIERAGDVTRRSEGGRGKREQRDQRYAGHTSNEHVRILAL